MHGQSDKRSSNYSEARQKIIDRALDLFYRQGYLATGINQIIAEAGVSKNTFYYYFPSKEDLCLAYLHERHKLWMSWLNEKIDSYGSPFERLMGVFDFLKSWLEKCDFRGCAFLNISSEVPDINHIIRQEVIIHKNELRNVLKSLVEALRTSEIKYAGINAGFLADALYIIFEGLISACQNYGDSSIIDSGRRNFLQLLEKAE
ncbi:MAG: TetR/AcrR family transcriptional regulator [Nitrospirae bacterium]|nr:TetR/AcrR family transcriptional regulator [Nitrospirota bacterium]